MELSTHGLYYQKDTTNQYGNNASAVIREAGYQAMVNFIKEILDVAIILGLVVFFSLLLFFVLCPIS